MSGLSGLSEYPAFKAFRNSKDESLTKTIPASVRNLRAEERDHDPGRQPRYIHRPEDRTPRKTWPEVRALVEDGVLHNDWIGPGAAIAVLDHEQAAICEFCDEVYVAWARFQAKTAASRLRGVVRASVIAIEPFADWCVLPSVTACPPW
jgi:hypothetical protein